MLIPYTLPQAQAPIQPNAERERPQPVAREPQAQRNPGRGTAEFIHRGEIGEDPRDSASAQRLFDQQISPASRSALLSYRITETSSLGQPERVGRYLDLFL